MRQRLRRQDGFTLVELLVSATVGIVVIFGVLALLDGTARVQARNVDRVDATSRGRIAMDLITRQLGSQVCMGASVPAVLAATPTSVDFYASLAPASPDRLTVQRRRLTYRSASNDVLEEVWDRVSGTIPNVVFATTPRTNVVASGIRPVSPNGGIFRFYGFALDPVSPTYEFATPVSAAERARIVRVAVDYTAFGRQAATDFSNQVYVRTADPTDPERSPKCL